MVVRLNLHLWGKLPSRLRAECHSLIFHLLDTGHVVEELWNGVLKSGLRSWLAASLGLNAEAARRWISLWA